MNLLHLSLQRCKRHTAPHAPTAEERLSAFHAAFPRPRANAWPWKHLRDTKPPAPKFQHEVALAAARNVVQLIRYRNR